MWLDGRGGLEVTHLLQCAAIPTQCEGSRALQAGAAQAMQGDQLLPLFTSLPRGPEKGWREVDGECHTEDGTDGCQGHRPTNHPHQVGEGH